MAELLDIFRAVADPTRMRIMHLLSAMELSVGEVAQAVGQSQPRVSRHVKILAEAALIDRRKEGNWVFLRLTPSPACQQLMAMFADIPEDSSEGLWLKADLARLAAIRAERMRAADEYFAAHAEEWDALGSLYVPEAEVEQAVLRALGTERFGHLLDLGTGTGRMIALLGAQADKVSAVDRSPDMLRLARAKLPQQAADKVNLMLEDFCALPFKDASADLVTAHQILHYSATPHLAILEAARVLKHDGRLMIVDFAAHNREELRSRDQHERLGFSDEQIGDWFTDAGLDMEQIDTLPGSELTVKLWLGRRKADNILRIRECKSS